MDILLIRHGQSEADILHRMEGRADFDLTDTGYCQAALMAKWITNYISLDKIYSSPLKRAAQTADELSKSTNISVILDDILMEWNNGLVAGLPIDEANVKYPPPINKFPHTSVYGQESDIEFRARAETALSKAISENTPESKIALVSHGGMISRLMQSFLMLPLVSGLHVHTGDTGVHHLRIDGSGGRHVIFMNSTSHLV